MRDLATGLVMLISGGLLTAHLQVRAPATSAIPNFSGAWELLADETSPVVRAEGVTANRRWETPLTITQDATTITITYTSRGRSHSRIRFIYNLDGTETQNIDGASVKPQERRSRAIWDAAKLTLLSVVDWPDPATGRTTPHEYREVITLESATTLRLETSRTVKANTATVVSRFRRTS